MRTNKPGPDRVPDATSLVPWPLLRMARHLYGHAPPDLLLFFAEALEEAATHADHTSLGTNPCAQGLRDLAADVRARAPTRDDTALAPDPDWDAAVKAGWDAYWRLHAPTENNSTSGQETA